MIAAGRVAKRLARFTACVLEAAGQAGRLRGDPRDRRDAAFRALLLSKVCTRLAEAHGLQIDRSGEIPSRPTVFVCNHVSYLDPVALAALVPSLPLSKAEVQGWPVIGRLMESLGVRFVRRDDAHSGAGAIRWMIRALRDGASVLAFPEGTTSDGSRVLPFKAGAFAAARHAGVAVVPLAISYGDAGLAWVGDDSFVPHYLRTASREVIEARIDACEPLRPTRYATDLELARRAAAAIAAALKESPWVSSARSSTSRAA